MAVARGWASWALRGHLLDARLGRLRNNPSAHYYYHPPKRTRNSHSEGKSFVNHVYEYCSSHLAGGYHMLKDSFPTSEIVSCCDTAIT
jgi:hypothetical protein